MSIRFVEIHAAVEPDALNTEWFVLENNGSRPFNTHSCTLGVARAGGKKCKPLGTIDPGFVIAPGEKVRVATGHPGRKAHGNPPEDGLKNYHLFLGESVLRGPGTVMQLALRTLEVTRAIYDPDAPGGVAAAAAKPAAK
jgi:hypothetical protein